MKIFIKKLSAVALFGFIMSSSMCLNGGTAQVTVNFPSQDFKLYRDKLKESFTAVMSWAGTGKRTYEDLTLLTPDDGSLSNTYTMNPGGKTHYRYIIKYKDKNIVTRDVANFYGKGVWNWTFDLDGTETREGLTLDNKTVLWSEVVPHPLDA